LPYFYDPLINYAVIRPLLVTDKNVANVKHFMAAKVVVTLLYLMYPVMIMTGSNVYNVGSCRN